MENQFINRRDEIVLGNDEFTERWRDGRSRWCVRLNTGEVIYMDDGRPGYEPSDGWSRLKKYCERTGYFIVNFWIQFRSNSVHLPENKDGYFFIKGLRAWIGDAGFQTFVTGYLEEGKVMIKKYQTPELLEIGSEMRNIDKCMECLILKENKNEIYNRGL